MSFNHLNNSVSPCMTVGCGDASRELLGLERMRLFTSHFVDHRTQNPSINRRNAHKLTTTNVKRSGSYSKITLSKCASNEKKSLKKASSCEDLSPNREEAPIRRKRPTQMPMKSKQDDKEAEEHKLDLSQAARRICQVLVLNAWRRKREDSDQLSSTIDKLGTQVDNLNIQTIVLKKLLDSEKERVFRAGEEVQQMVVRVEESFRERDAARAEKEEVDREVSRLETCLLDANTRCQNMKNDFMTARSEMASMELQMNKERDKLAKLREDKKLLLEKAQMAEEAVSMKSAAVERLNSLVTELRGQLQVQEMLNSATQSAEKALRQLETDQAKLAKDLMAMQIVSEQFKDRVVLLEDQLKETDHEKTELEHSLQEKQHEIARLRREVQHYTELHNTWCARALRFMSSFARVPLLLLSNLALVLAPFPPPSR